MLGGSEILLQAYYIYCNEYYPRLGSKCPVYTSNSRVNYYRTLLHYYILHYTLYTIHFTLRVCVCFLPSSFWTSSSLDVPAGVTQEEGHTVFFIHLLSAVRALIFLARRIQPFLSLVDRAAEFCVLTISSFSTRWAFLFLFYIFLVRKIPFVGVELTYQRFRGLRGTSELPGRPAIKYKL